MQLRERLQRDGKMGIVVIAVWAENLAGVYSAEEAASRLGYLRTGPDRRRRLQNHHDEYLVEGGIAPDEYRILGIFQGDGPEREVTFESQFYTISTKIPGGLFSGSRSTNALRDIEDEIFSHSGVRDDKKRDLLVHEIGGVSNIFAFLQYKYQ